MVIVLFFISAILTVSLYFVCKRYYPFWAKGNSPKYWPITDTKGADPLLKDRYIFSFGSSINCGMGSLYFSYTTFLARETGVRIHRASMNGSTIAHKNGLSYGPRFDRQRKVGNPDLVLIQIAANDASHKMSSGHLSESFNIEDLDTSTTAGGLEYLVARAKQRYNCPIALYTLPKYDNPMYHHLVNMAKRVCRKWDVELIDMWNDKAFNNITPEQRKLYYADYVHPTMAGYRQWWTPYFKKELTRIFMKADNEGIVKRPKEINA